MGKSDSNDIYTIDCCAIKIGFAAVDALVCEVLTTPKPGLVDLGNNGAHSDMDISTFMSSIGAIAPYFIQYAKKGAMWQDNDKMDHLLSQLRPIGVLCENAMFKATGSINTHKGAIFSMGVLAAASGYCLSKYASSDIKDVCHTASKMCSGIVEKELGASEIKMTNGERLYRDYGVRGIRGEAQDGFPTILNISFPALKELNINKLLDKNDKLIQVLLHLISVVEDTNILARHNMDTLKYVHEYAKTALSNGGMFTLEGRKTVNEMDKDFIKKRISPGGCADLLAATIMLDELF